MVVISLDPRKFYFKANVCWAGTKALASVLQSGFVNCELMIRLLLNIESLTTVKTGSLFVPISLSSLWLFLFFLLPTITRGRVCLKSRSESPCLAC